MEYKPLSGREFPRFSAIKTFFRLPFVAPNADYEIGIFGVPYDGGTSYRPGARFAPTKVREVSSLGRSFHWDRGVDLFNRWRVADIGDCPTVPIDQGQTYSRIEEFVANLTRLDKKFVAVGGDHSITLPILRSLRKKAGQAIQLIHFDAHLDTYPAAWGCEFHHGAFARHAVLEGLIDPKNSLQIGLRGPLASPDDLNFVREHGLRAITVDDLRQEGLTSRKQKMPKFTGPCYITYDVDCLDPAFAPGTGTPVVGGLTTYETQILLRALQIENLLAADVVEFCPAYDHAEITALAALDALYEILCLFKKPGK